MNKSKSPSRTLSPIKMAGSSNKKQFLSPVSNNKLQDQQRLSSSKQVQSYSQALSRSGSKLQNLMNSSKIVTNTIQDRTIYQQNKYGMLLERVCTKKNHDRSKIMYVCLDENCQQDRFGCAHCFLNDHIDHSNKKVLLENFIDQLQKKQLGFLDTIQHFNKIADLFYQQSFGEQMLLNLEDIKVYFNQLIDQLKIKVGQQIQEALDQEKFYINCEISKQKYILDQMQVSVQNTIFDMDQQSFNVASNLINDRYQQDLFQVVKQLQDKYTDMQNKYSSSVTQLKDNIMDQLKYVFNAHNELVLPPNQGSSEDLKLNTLYERKKSLESILKDQQRVQQQYKEVNNSIEETHHQILQEKFQYNIYTQSCSHVIPCNTIPVFDCCNQAYQCQVCHDKQTNHRCYLSNPSKRYCQKCLRIFEVPFFSNVSINCNGCLMQGK